MTVFQTIPIVHENDILKTLQNIERHAKKLSTVREPNNNKST